MVKSYMENMNNILTSMPKIIRWEELPEIKEGDYD